MGAKSILEPAALLHEEPAPEQWPVTEPILEPGPEDL
jgi:hypothetical protein